MIESWRKVWRDGVAPLLSHDALLALRGALESDDETLIQGATTQPPPLMAVQDWPCEGACAVSYGPWKGDGLNTIGELEEAFARLCYETDARLGEPGGIRWLLCWYDETPRDVMRRELLPEVIRAIGELEARAA